MLATTIVTTSCYNERIDEQEPEAKPNDGYVGENTLLGAIMGCADLDVENITLYIKAPDSSIIKRQGRHRTLSKEKSELLLDHGLANGSYQLLYVEYEDKEENGENATKERGLGCRVSIENDEVTVASKWNSTLGMYGSGGEEGSVDTIYISSSDHMLKLAALVNDSRTNGLIGNNLYFKQACDINGWRMSFNANVSRGWTPIGAYYTTPFCSTFDGDGHSIKGLYINRSETIVVGLFGFTYGACIRNVNIVEASLLGDFGVGGIVAIATSNELSPKGTFMENCTVTDSDINGATDSFGVGGLVGVVDQFASINMYQCRSIDNTIAATSNAGGIVGAGSRLSCVAANMCENSSSVRSDYNSAGGIVAVCDTLIAGSCINTGYIYGSTKFTEFDEEQMRNGLGTGGIAGGTGIALVMACENHQEVVGVEGVGGIIGSSRVSGNITEDDEELLYNDVILLHCSNTANISGERLIAGMCGESQFTAYGCLNEGHITASGEYASGIVAAGATACVYNSINAGNISSDKYAAGMVAVTGCSDVIACQNYGYIKTINAHAAGIVSIARSATAINYCANFGTVESVEDGPIALLLAEAGTADEWTALEIATLVYAGVETVVGVAGGIGSIKSAHRKHLGLPDGTSKIGKVLDIGSAVSGVSFAITDAYILGTGIKDLIDEYHFNDMIDEYMATLLDDFDTTKAKIASMRNSYQLPDYGLTASILDDRYKKYIEELDKYFGEDGNLDEFSENVAISLEQQRQGITDFREGKEVFHKVISGIALCLTAASTIVATVVTAGAAVPAVIAGIAGAAGVAGALIGGANTYWEVFTTDQPNLFDMSQCVAAGELKSSFENSKAGGAVGVLNDFCEIEDCLVVGRGCAGAGHLVGKMCNSSQMHNCLTIAPIDAWGSEEMYVDLDARAKVSGLYYCIDPYDATATTDYTRSTRAMSSAKGISKSDMDKMSEFGSLDFNETYGAWIIPTGYDFSFPIPYVSRYTLAPTAE